MLIYKIKIPKNKNADKFAKFMREKYLPEIHEGPTRSGQVTGFELLQGQNDREGVDMTHDFFLHVGWSGLSLGAIHVNNPEVVKKFMEYSPVFERLGCYEEAVSLHSA